MEGWNAGRLVFKRILSIFYFIFNTYFTVNPTLHYPSTHYSNVPSFQHSNWGGAPKFFFCFLMFFHSTFDVERSMFDVHFFSVPSGAKNNLALMGALPADPFLKHNPRIPHKTVPRTFIITGCISDGFGFAGPEPFCSGNCSCCCAAATGIVIRQGL